MKTTSITLLCLIISAFSALAQSDTIFTTTGIIVCSIKEVAPEVVKYTYPNEDVLNSAYKNSIQKIVFRSGRVQTFAEAMALKRVTGAKDFAKVGITQSEYDVRGLYRLGELTTRAKGGTGLSSSENVKERAYKKLKIEAAMYGANLIFLAASSTAGNQVGTAFQSPKRTQTDVTGIAYSNSIPEFEDFKKKVGDRRKFESIDLSKFDDSFFDLVTDDFATNVEITEIFTENGLTLVKADVKRIGIGRYRVIYFDDDSFTLMFKKGGILQNIRVKF